MRLQESRSINPESLEIHNALPDQALRSAEKMLQPNVKRARITPRIASMMAWIQHMRKRAFQFIKS